ncbi:MAG: hypothetical protein ABIH23_20840, partial [bacterium]
MGTLRLFYLIPLFFFVMGNSLVGFGETIILVEKGVPRFQLALNENPEPDEELAATEFCHYVERMSGAIFQRVSKTAKEPKLVLGIADGGGKKLGPEECLIEMSGKDLHILGGSARATLWAVYGILHELGCRWYIPGEIGEVVPTRKTLTINGEKRVDSPDFPFRQIWYSWGGPEDGGARFHEWNRRNRCITPHVSH